MTKNARDLAMELTDVHGYEGLLVACLKYMSLADIEDMLEANEYLEPFLNSTGGGRGWLQDNYNINKHS